MQSSLHKNSISSHENGIAPRFLKTQLKHYVSQVIFMISIFLSFTMIGIFIIRAAGTTNILYVDLQEPILFKVNEKFLSLGLDSSVIATGFKGFNMTSPKLVKMIKYLSPAYFRIGGNLADRLVFIPESPTYFKTITLENDVKECSHEECSCQFCNTPNFTMNGAEWLMLNDLAKETNLNLLFDLNVLRRFENDSWDYRNSLSLIEFSNSHQLDVSWELGNEPNSFRHQFNYEVNASQLAADFRTLKGILGRYPNYKNSKLVGPDTTRPQIDNKQSTKYLEEFLSEAGDIVDVITWHQYYFNGRTVHAVDFLDPEIFDVLKWQISEIHRIEQSLNLTGKYIWLGETASAWGGGSPRYSDRYISGFIWLDKLGISAKMGIDVVIRQSIYNGYYALLDHNYMPNPDWWISILYKTFVGPEVVRCYSITSPKVRLYCHCSKTYSRSVTIFGMNLDDTTASVRIEGLVQMEYDPFNLFAYIITPGASLLEKDVYMNGKQLKLTQNNDLPVFIPKVIVAQKYVTMPPYSMVFWIIPISDDKICI